MERKLVTVVSHPRSGSTYFLREAGKLDKLCAKMELFHQNEEIIDQHLGALSTKVRNSLGCQEEGFREKLLLDPIRYLSLVHKEADAEVLAFKAFPKHLPEEKLTVILQSSEVTIFLLRNILHSYISSEIAKKIGRYTSVDTSDIKVEFSPSAFLWWVKFITEHFERAFATLYELKKPLIVINYENFRSNPHRLRWLANELSEKLGTQLEVVESGAVMTQQDSRTSALDKVSNPKEMFSFLSKHGLTYLVDGNATTRYPDLRRLAPSVCRKYRQKFQPSHLLYKLCLSAKRTFRIG